MGTAVRFTIITINLLLFFASVAALSVNVTDSSQQPISEMKDNHICEHYYTVVRICTLIH